MTEQVLVVVLVGLLAAAPGVTALLLGRKRAADRLEEAAARETLLDQMQEQIDSQQKTIRFLAAQVNELQQARARDYTETEALRHENEALREEGRELREEMSDLRRGVGELIRQMEEAKLTPVWKPATKPATASKRPSRTHDPVALRKKIVVAFSLREIGDLAFELGIDPDEVPGETATDRARALVTYAQDRGRLDELVALCGEKRPNGGFDDSLVRGKRK